MLLNRILIALIAVVAAGLLAFALVKGARLLTGTEPSRTGAIVATGEAGLGGPFTLTDSNGKPVTNADFRGRFMLIYFGYAFCPDICPTELQAMGRALDDLGPKTARVTPVFISVDPARDTPASLKPFVRAFHPRMVGLTGTPEQIAAVTKAFRVYYRLGQPSRPGAKDYLVDHTSFFYLVGPDGDFRAVLRGGVDAPAIVKALEQLVR
jgi:cytochrome oxidase Cu insertion factor (SCO1/SenC/PrrC family)